jgi:hypothetical protein
MNIKPTVSGKKLYCPNLSDYKIEAEYVFRLTFESIRYQKLKLFFSVSAMTV